MSGGDDDNVVSFNGTTTVDHTPENFIRMLRQYVLANSESIEDIFAVVVYRRKPLTIHSSSCDLPRVAAFLTAGAQEITQRVIDYHKETDDGPSGPSVA